MLDNWSNSCLSGSLRPTGTLLVGSWTTCTVWSISRCSCPYSFPSAEKTSLYRERQSSFLKSPLNSIAVHGKYILFLIVSSGRCSLALKPRMDLHAPLTIRNSMLLRLLVLWVQHLERFAAQRFNSDFLYITRVTDGLSRSSSAFSPFSFFTVLSAIMFSVDLLSSWNFSSFPLTSRDGAGWGCHLRLTNWAVPQLQSLLHALHLQIPSP